MKPSQSPKYFLHGVPVYSFLFATIVRIPQNERVIAHLFQVEAFNLDDAWKRLKAAKPQIKPDALDFIEPLEPEHDVGYLGEKIDLTPLSKLKRPAPGAH